MAKILIVEDEPYIHELLNDKLTALRHSVDVAENGNDAMLFLQTYKYELVILDVNIPGLNGFEVLKRLRMAGGVEKVLMLTARSEIESKLIGFASGADDYLAKPFDFRELQARISALLARPTTITPDCLRYHEFELNVGSSELRYNGNLVKLGPKDLSLIELLMRHPNEIFSTNTLLERVWSADSNASSEGLRSCISRIRRALEQVGADGLLVENINRVGYRLKKMGSERL